MAHSVVFSFTSPKTHPPAQPQWKWRLSVENMIRFCLYFFVTGFFSCHLDKHQRDFSMREVALPTLGGDGWVPAGWICRCNWWTKIRNKLSSGFEGLKWFLPTPQPSCSNLPANTTPTAEVSETLWRAVTALLFEYLILSTGKKGSHLWSHLLLDSVAFFAWVHIFKEFKYPINAQLVEACGNLELIPWEEVFHGKF